jgi:hypothetical protein
MCHMPECEPIHPSTHLIRRDNIAIADGGECDECKVETAQVALREVADGGADECGR